MKGFKKISFDEYSQNNDDIVLVFDNVKVQNPLMPALRKNVIILNGLIVAIDNDDHKLPDSIKAVCRIDCSNFTLTPGLIDQHIHGGYGCDFNTANADDIIKLSQKLPAHGITTILPTIMTDSLSKIKDQINEIKKADSQKPSFSTKFQGVNLEGPFLSQEYKGIQSPKNILKPTIEDFKKIEDPFIKMVTYSPELDEGFELTKYLTSKNIIPSAGHTGASAENIHAAQKNGLKQTTHTFNAMPALHHRNPGVIGEALINDDIYTELITDCVHVHPIVLEIALRSKPIDKVIFVSDSLPLNEAEEDFMEFGSHEIFKAGTKAVNNEGVMAGSLMFLDQSFKVLKAHLNLDFSKFIKYASQNVAQNLGLNNIGYIKQGNIADLVLWNGNHDVCMTLINGKVAYTEQS